MIKLYGLKNCDTCRKALKAILKAGKAAELIDIRARPLERETLVGFLEAFGAVLVNTRSTTWRSLSEVERAGDEIDLISVYPALMKRPVIVGSGECTLGWDAKTRAFWLLSGAG